MGKFDYVHVAFGLAQISAYFQRFVNEVLTGLDFSFRYLDDILIFSLDIKMHLIHLKIVFQRLWKTDLKVKDKSVIF